MNKISVVEIRQVFERIINKLELENEVNVEFEKDLYRYIPTDQWDKYDEVVIEEGSLYDDLDSLRLLANDPKRPCTYVDFDRIASVLRAISQKNNPA